MNGASTRHWLEFRRDEFELGLHAGHAVGAQQTIQPRLRLHRSCGHRSVRNGWPREAPNDLLELDADPGPRDLAWVVALAADPCVQPDG
jgi:hypothetical protein